MDTIASDSNESHTNPIPSSAPLSEDLTPSSMAPRFGFPSKSKEKKTLVGTRKIDNTLPYYHTLPKEKKTLVGTRKIDNTLPYYHSLTSSTNMGDVFEARQEYRHFRILVIGPANAGKTALLKRFCNTTDEPCIYDEQSDTLVRSLPSCGRSPTLITKLQTSWATLLLLSAGSTISTAHSPLPATRSSSSTILLGLRQETRLS